jgi:PIN domain nuclease of toxin-antitoxin system
LTSSTPTTPEPLYVVDTHALIWYLLGDKKLSKHVQVLFQAAERGETRLVLPAIVLAELYFANEKREWFPDFKSVYRDILSKGFFKFLPFDHQHVLDFDRDAGVPEMHDRIITGVARRLGAPLITSDPLIQSTGTVKTEW